MGERGLLTPALAGIVASLVGFASTFALVLAGLRAVGADPAQAASGLLALCVLMGVVAIGLALRTRMPVAIAWSTPGAALLVSTGDVPGGYPAALGAFAVTGALIALCGLWRPLARWIARIPVPLAGAMLAGVVLPLCVAPVRAVVDNADGRLRPAMFATVWVESGDRRETVVVSEDAVQFLDGRPVVFVARADGVGGARFERREVEIGATVGGRTQIVRGIAPGDSVVVAGTFAVKSEFSRAKLVEE